MPPTTAIVFDLDGTLVNSLPDICHNLNLLRARRGLSTYDEAFLRPLIGQGLESFVAGAMSEFQKDEFPELIQEYRSIYLEYPGVNGHIYPGVLETLTWLRKNPATRLAIATNKSHPVALKTLEHYLPDFKFDVVRGREKVSRCKPDKAHLLEVLAELEISPHRAWFVGDDPVDLQCAQSAQVRFLAAGYGFGNVVAPASQTLKQFNDLIHHLSEIQ